MRSLLNLLRAAVPTVLLAASCLAQAQGYPARPVHVIFPYPPGSPLDAIGREHANPLIREQARTTLQQLELARTRRNQ